MGVEMTPRDIARQRLRNQRLVGTPCETPAAAVQWLCAVQAQDYAGAKWAVAQRTTGATNAALDRVFDDGTILRTHVMRPTWHFVTPADIRWLLALTAPRVHAANASYYRRLELDDTVFARSNALIARALQGGSQLTRAELARALDDGGIAASGQRLAYLLMRAELDAVIGSGARRGKQFTYALLDERVPATRGVPRDEALAMLTRRYFASHGPATLQDYAWWSGLAASDVRAGVAMAAPHLAHERVGDRTYWFTTPMPTACVPNPTVHLLPNYDEHLVAYRDHRASFDASVLKDMDPRNTALIDASIVLNGHVVGGWRRTVGKNAVAIETNLFAPLDRTALAAVAGAAEGYGRFMGMPVTLR